MMTPSARPGAEASYIKIKHHGAPSSRHIPVQWIRMGDTTSEDWVPYTRKTGERFMIGHARGAEIMDAVIGAGEGESIDTLEVFTVPPGGVRPCCVEMMEHASRAGLFPRIACSCGYVWETGKGPELRGRVWEVFRSESEPLECSCLPMKKGDRLLHNVACVAHTGGWALGVPRGAVAHVKAKGRALIGGLEFSLRHSRIEVDNTRAGNGIRICLRGTELGYKLLDHAILHHGGAIRLELERPGSELYLEGQITGCSVDDGETTAAIIGSRVGRGEMVAVAEGAIRAGEMVVATGSTEGRPLVKSARAERTPAEHAMDNATRAYQEKKGHARPGQVWLRDGARYEAVEYAEVGRGGLDGPKEREWSGKWRDYPAGDIPIGALVLKRFGYPAIVVPTCLLFSGAEKKPSGWRLDPASPTKPEEVREALQRIVGSEARELPRSAEREPWLRLLVMRAEELYQLRGGESASVWSVALEFREWVASIRPILGTYCARPGDGG